jgi:hypothetical protein
MEGSKSSSIGDKKTNNGNTSKTINGSTNSILGVEVKVLDTMHLLIEKILTKTSTETGNNKASPINNRLKGKINNFNKGDNNNRVKEDNKILIRNNNKISKGLGLHLLRGTNTSPIY